MFNPRIRAKNLEKMTNLTEKKIVLAAKIFIALFLAVTLAAILYQVFIVKTPIYL